MDSKIIFIDVDDTLVDSRTHKVPDSAVKALHALRKNGYTLCIATGRSIHSLHHGGFDDQLFDWDGYVCNNGQLLYNQKKEQISAHYIKQEAVLACIELGMKNNSPIQLEGEVTMLTSEPNEYVFTAHHFFDEPIPEVGEFHGENIIMMCAYAPLGYDYHDYQTIDGIDVLPGQSTYADIVAQGYTKWNGIQEMLHIFHKDGFIAIGDSLNDIEMMEHAALSIAMGQGHEKTKSVASYVTTPVYEDGIFNACIALQLFDDMQK